MYLLGKGGHAEVYRARLPDGQDVAVKRLMKNEKEAEDRVGDFLSELGIIAHINHPNATRLMGFGIDRGLYFVLQFASHGSLASLLFGASLHPSLASEFISSLCSWDFLSYMANKRDIQYFRFRMLGVEDKVQGSYWGSKRIAVSPS